VNLGGPLKEKCITVSLGPFESKILTLYNCCWGPLWKQGRLLYFTHYSCKRGPEASASLAFP